MSALGSCLLSGGLLVATCLPAQQPPGPVLAIRDLRPKFLEFYGAAIKEQASNDRRFELWEQMYNFAAVPPTPEGDHMARRILDDAWPRYADALPLSGRVKRRCSHDPPKR